MTDKEQIKVLLVEDQIVQVQLMTELFRLVGSSEFKLFTSRTLEEALSRLSNERIDLILLDLNLPDSHGYETFSRVQELQLDIPVILMTATDDEQFALKAIQDGAQDFLVKGEVDAKLLFRAIRYAIERHQMQSELRSLSLTDELTGLYNRRGFSTLATQHLKLARRTGQSFLIVFADLDDLKSINDTYGHAEGDAILIETANILRNTFRESDIISRYGGDEFLVLVTDASYDDKTSIYSRIHTLVDKFNKSDVMDCYLSLSLGVVSVEPNKDFNLDNIVAEADKALYVDKLS